MIGDASFTTATHTRSCPAPEPKRPGGVCGRWVGREAVCCPLHWKRVPEDLRDRILEKLHAFNHKKAGIAPMRSLLNEMLIALGGTPAVPKSPHVCSQCTNELATAEEIYRRLCNPCIEDSDMLTALGGKSAEVKQKNGQTFPRLVTGQRVIVIDKELACVHRLGTVERSAMGALKDTGDGIAYAWVRMDLELPEEDREPGAASTHHLMLQTSQVAELLDGSLACDPPPRQIPPHTPGMRIEPLDGYAHLDDLSERTQRRIAKGLTRFRDKA